MASRLPTEQHASYSAIIDDILSTSDLNTVSAKAIRKELQNRVDYDLNPQKSEIKDLIMERFDKVHQQLADSAAGAPTSNGAAHAHDTPDDEADDFSPPSTKKRKQRDERDEETSELEDESPAPKKSKKSKPRDVESDEKLAARLQAELNAQSRSTRGGGSKRKQPAKKEKKGKKKSAAKVRADDDSELEGENGEKPEKEKKGGFHKPMNLSEPLAAMLGESQLSRPQTVKKIWQYVKSRDLQDPADKRQIMCDDAMRAVFKGDKVHMFTMNKLLASHLYPTDEVV